MKNILFNRHIALGQSVGYSSYLLFEYAITIITGTLYKYFLTCRKFSTNSMGSPNSNPGPVDHLKQFLAKLGKKPVVMFTNLSNIQEVANSVRHYAGIYAFLNKDTGDVYIGSATQGNMPTRFKNHIESKEGGSSRIAAALKEYDVSSFVFIVIETVPPIVTRADHDDLALETSYITSTNSTYNVLKHAGKGASGYRFTEEQKAEFRANYTQARRDAVAAINKGGLSDSHRENIRLASLNRAPMSEETKKAISLGSKSSRWYIVSLVDGSTFTGPDGNICTSARIFTTQGVADFCNVSLRTVTRAIADKGTFVVKQSRNPNATVSQRTFKIAIE